MAYELNIFDPAQRPGLTVTGRLYAAGALARTVAMANLPAGSGLYTNPADLTGLAAGSYDVTFDSGDPTLLGTGRLDWTGSAEAPPPGGTEGTTPATCYLSVAAADALAATLPAALVAAYVAVADAGARAALLLQASDDVDHAMRYQGRRYDTVGQRTEFPRVPYEPTNAILPTVGAVGDPGGAAWGATVWDLDPVTLLPVVPPAVLSATLYQASYLAGGESPDADDQHKGIRDQAAGSRRQSAELDNRFNATGLCRRAWRVMWRYRLTSGRLM